MSVCCFCQDQLFVDLDWKDEDLDHHTDSTDWMQSIQVPCVICQTLWNAVKTAIYQSTGEIVAVDDQGNILASALRHSIGDAMPLFQARLTESNAVDEFKLLFSPIRDNIQKLVARSTSAKPISIASVHFTIAPSEELITKSDIRASLASSTDSDRSFAQIEKWLSDCSSDKHPKCHHLSELSSVYVPRRLLDLGLKDKNKARIVETDQSQSFRRYATLSHCWGTQRIKLCLVKDNIDQLKTSIPLDDTFPKNFKDAIRVARAVGLRYIWIDSLCIIQGDATDWVQEGLNMDQLYGSSYLNIAVACSDNSEGGLFRSRNPQSLQPCTIQTIDWQGQPMTCSILQDNFWTNELLSEPLYRRAWVLQERTLSSRTLHFGRRQLFWQCLTTAACESMPDGIPTTFFDQASRDELHWRQLLERNTPTSELTTKNRIDLQNLWKHAVDTYTRCNITQIKDKLPAISGLAKIMSKSSGEAWLAGLWENDLVQQMAWQVRDCRTEDGQPSSRQTADEYRAPSWSWASVTGTVELPDRVSLRRDYELQIVGAPVLEYGDSKDVFGKVTKGHLDVRGTIHTVLMIRASTGSEDWTLKLKSGKKVFFFLRADEPLKPQGSADVNQAEDVNGEISVVVMPLFYRKQNDQYTGRGLAVRCVGTSTGDIERIGLVEFDSIKADVWDETMGAAQRKDENFRFV